MGTQAERGTVPVPGMEAGPQARRRAGPGARPPCSLRCSWSARSGGGAVVMSADAWSHWGRWGGGGHKGHHADPARWKGHMEDHALFWLDRVDATDEQREAVRTIVGQAFDDLSDAVGEHRALRREWLTELERPELDAGALEALRTRHLALVDGKSRRALEAIVEAGSVLTAEQRAELVSMLSWHRDRRGERRRGSDEG